VEDRAKYLVERDWDEIKKYQWRWEFIRRCPQFQVETDPGDFFNQTNRFVDIWDLPHPGPSAVQEYLPLPDFRTLLIRVTGHFLEDSTIPDPKEELRNFAKALGGEGFHYRGDHSLVTVTGGGFSVNDLRASRYVECKVRVPFRMQWRFREILEQLERKGIAWFEWDRRKTGLIAFERPRARGCPPFLMTIKVATVSDDCIDEVRRKVSEVARDVLNLGLRPLRFWQRKDPVAWCRQINFLDAEKGLRPLDGLRASVDPQADWKDVKKNSLRAARHKISVLEEQAAHRRKLLGVP
jgi:hypothetical protein